MPLAFRAICPWCGCELPNPLAEGNMAWFERNPEDPDPIASFEEDMARKIGAAARRVVTDDEDACNFFNNLKCPHCRHYLVTAFIYKRQGR